MKRVVAIVVIALFVAACGDEGLLDGVGDRAQDAVIGSTAATTTTVPDSGDGVVLRFREAAEMAWWNDGIADQEIGEPSYTREFVWARGGTRVIQASRAEIAAVLPGVEFPRLVAEDIGWATSQLVFDVASAQLDPGTSAQFGLWASEPYTLDQVAVAVLRVGRPAEDAIRGEIIPEIVSDGLSLNWVDGEYRYELFCQATLAEEYCLQMARSIVPLGDLLLAVET
jgi:hypothetical protein